MRDWRKPLLSALLWLAAAGWCGVLFFFSGQNAAESSSLSLRVTEFVLRMLPFLHYTVEELHPILRDMAHFAIFAVEGALLGAAMMTTLRERFMGGLLSVLCCAVVAVLNEYHQSFSLGRSCEVKDMLIDSAGGLTGVLFAALVLFLGFSLSWKLRQRRKNVIIS